MNEITEKVSKTSIISWRCVPIGLHA